MVEDFKRFVQRKKNLNVIGRLIKADKKVTLESIAKKYNVPDIIISI